MIKIKDYAKSRGVSYEAVRKQLKRYESELQDHIEKHDRTQFLDDFAVEFLDNKRNSNPVIVMETAKDEELERLRNENKTLLLKLAESQEERIKDKELIQELLVQKTELLLKVNDLQLLIEKKDAEQQNQEQQVKKKWWKIF